MQVFNVYMKYSRSCTMKCTKDCKSLCRNYKEIDFTKHFVTSINSVISITITFYLNSKEFYDSASKTGLDINLSSSDI